MTDIEKHIEDLQSLVEEYNKLKEFNIRLMNVLTRATLAAGGLLPLLYDDENGMKDTDYSKLLFFEGSNEVLRIYEDKLILGKNAYIKTFNELPRLKKEST